MYQSVLCLTTATAHIWAVGKSVWNSGSRSNNRDCALGERTSRKARASKTVGDRCWTMTRLWRRHRPRSEQAGILHYKPVIEGGSLAFA